MTTRTALLSFELAAAYRGRTTLLFALGFAIASVGVALVGLAPGGVVTVQGFARTSVSLLQLVLWVVPLLGLATGALAGAECHELEFVAALPVRRERIVTARWAAWTIVLGACLAIGFGAAGLVIGALAGVADGGRYLALCGVALVLVAVSLALGLWIGVAARSRARAVAVAVVTWFALAIGLDLVAIALLAILPAREAGWSLSLLLLADPVDSARALGLGLFQADVIAGPTGAALRRVLGGSGAWLLAAGLVAWTVVPLVRAGKRFARSDL
jgi:Cu-processing system permease protein